MNRRPIMPESGSYQVRIGFVSRRRRTTPDHDLDHSTKPDHVVHVRIGFVGAR